MMGAGIDFSCQWMGPNGFTSTNWIIDQLPAGDYFLTATTTCGQVMNHLYTITEPAWWNIAPNVTSPSCANESDGAFAPVVTGGTPNYGFQWIGPNGYTSIDPVINGLSAGAYQLTITDANGCLFSADYTLQSNDSYGFSLGNDLTLCLNDVIEINGPSGANLIYYWQDGSANPSYTIQADQWGLGSHSLTLNVVTTSGCFGTDQLGFVVNDCVNVEEVEGNAFYIFPNPSVNGELNIEQRFFNSIYMELLDMTGRIVKSSFVQPAFSTFDFSDLEMGSYVVRFMDKNGTTLGQEIWIINDMK
jgi:hypothetical protein